MHTCSLFALLSAPRVVLPEDANTNILLLLRWIHFLAGITWVGLLYFFNLVNVPFMKTVDATAKPNVFRNLTLPALWWFRWGALVTVLAGIGYWSIIVNSDAHNGGGKQGPVYGSFFLIWIVAWAIEYFLVLRAPATAALNKGPIVAAIVAVIVILAGWLWLHFNSYDWASNRMISIGIGGGLGLIMLLNVWGIIWRNNKKIINGTLAGTPPADAPALARQAFLASRTNAWLSIPMLFFMAAASHYPMFGSLPPTP